MTPEEDALAEELIAPLVAFDERLAQAANAPAPEADAVPLAPALCGRWGRLCDCLRLLRHSFPPVPAALPWQAPASFGRFRLRRELGRGGFGIVFLADDPVLGRAVALKVPRPEVLADAGLRERFLREAQAAAGLDHPNVVPVHEAGEIGPVCYIVSAYCPGPTLAAWLKQQGGPVEPRLAAALVAALAAAVQHAHEHGIFHRDLKPANVLLAPRPAEAAEAAPVLPFVPRLTDFGLAKLLEAEVDQTTTGVLVGTPPYMAPEQAEGWVTAVGAATDVYALGVILYELLTGRLPFQGESLLATLDQVRTGQPEPLRRLRPDVPADLETVCLKCLRRDPTQRYASAAELSADLARFGHGEPVQARPLGPLGWLYSWCRRPERLRDASVVAFCHGTVALLVSTSGEITLSTGLLPSTDTVAAVGYLLLFTIGIFPAQLWVARQTIRRNRVALWLGLSLPLIQAALQCGGATGIIPAGGIVDRENGLAAWQAQVFTVLGLIVLQMITFTLALVAYRANRHVPGFLPGQPSARASGAGDNTRHGSAQTPDRPGQTRTTAPGSNGP